MKKTSCGIIVGRFQVDDLHDGHKELIDYVVNRHQKVMIFLGLSPLKATRNNPMDFSSRKKMIEEYYPHINVFYIKDIRDDVKWSKELDTMISDNIGPSFEVTLYGSRESFINYYHGKYPTKQMDQNQFVSGTEIRNQIGIETKGSKDFRSGVIWATYNQYPKVYPTVDIAIFNEDYTKILLAKKPHENKYRFVGGFVDINETYEHAAKREVYEETHLEIGDLKYVASFVVDDWRYRRELDKITTILFSAKLTFGIPTPDDDIAELKWFVLSEINENNVVEEHIPLLNELKKK